MTPTTLIMAYYDNPGMLATHYQAIRDLPQKLRDLLHVIVVDDGSPRWPAVAQELKGVPLQVYRMREDVRWNQDACRNIGVHHSETEWLFLTDIDHLVPEKTWQALLTNDWDKKHVFTFRRKSLPDLEDYKMHPNTWFMSRTIYNQAGGYDERFAGLYGTDADFRDRVKAAVGKIRERKEHIIRVPRTEIPDASTTTYLRKQPEDREGIARIKNARAEVTGWKPITLTFNYDRVYP